MVAIPRIAPWSLMLEQSGLCAPVGNIASSLLRMLNEVSDIVL